MKQKKGRPKLPDDQLRSHRVVVKLNLSELARLESGRPNDVTKGEWLRRLALARELPKPVPEINRQAWEDLARSAANLNQLAHAVNLGDLPELSEIRAELQAFRNRLV